jgi:homospermidine synthase
VDHGANPGLVSHFVKQGLLDICTKIIAESLPSQRKEALEKALAKEDFPQLAYLSGLKTIHISERDTQITLLPKRVNEFVNTWSVEGFIEEGVAPAEMGWGTHEVLIPEGAIFHTSGPGNQICLAQKGAKTWVRSWVPSGEITGMVIRHGEAFSLSDYLTVWQDGSPLYRPTVHYAYCPCDCAVNSIHELEMRAFTPQSNHRLLSNDIVDGKDELGCLLMGHDYQSWWIGSVLDIHEARQLVTGQNATTVQVAIGVVAALIYAIRHPNEGFCLPDDLNFREILDVARPYLGQFISQPVAWHPLLRNEAFANYGEESPSSEHMWQFKTFQV